MSTLNPESDVARLMNGPAPNGTVEWIGLRAERRAPLQSVKEAEASKAITFTGKARANVK